MRFLFLSFLKKVLIHLCLLILEEKFTGKLKEFFRKLHLKMLPKRESGNNFIHDSPRKSSRRVKERMRSRHLYQRFIDFEHYGTNLRNHRGQREARGELRRLHATLNL